MILLRRCRLRKRGQSRIFGFLIFAILTLFIGVRNKEFKAVVNFLRTKRVDYVDIRKVIRESVPESLYSRHHDDSSVLFPVEQLRIPPPNITFKRIQRDNPSVQSGGEWRPNDDLMADRLAVVIPYKNREVHRRQLLSVLHPLLQRQRIHYRIFVVEQINDGYFNKGMIMNIAFLVADVILRFDCVIFHDVDMVPTSYTIPYHCPRSITPRHMSGNITDKYDVFYSYLIGGVLNVPRDTFIKVNGYSNSYWGWGAEDDDLYHRFYHHGYSLDRYPVSPPYVMLPHQSRMISMSYFAYRNRVKLLHTQELVDRSAQDGLTTLPRHKISSIKSYPLYTHIRVDIEDTPQNG